METNQINERRRDVVGNRFSVRAMLPSLLFPRPVLVIFVVAVALYFVWPPGFISWSSVVLELLRWREAVIFRLSVDRNASVNARAPMYLY